MREKTNLTLHPSVKKAALALAESQGRSLSELVERLLEREVERDSVPTGEETRTPSSKAGTASIAKRRKQGGSGSAIGKNPKR
jgi:hypothetical protein